MSTVHRAGTTGTTGVRLEHGYRALVPRLGRVSALIPVRSVIVCAILAVAVAALGIASLGMGSFPLGIGEVIDALLGRSDQQTRLLVVGWRLPRMLFAVLCGTALALSGAIFQSLTRNPLGSPDIIGFSSGSYTGAIVVMLLLGSSRYLDIAAGALLGGCVTAAVVYLLAIRRGSVQSFRLIIMGIGIGAMLSSLNSGLMLMVDVDTAMLAAVWGAGSLNALGHAQLWPMALCLAVLLVLLVAVAAPLRQLELGDDAARSLGLRANRIRALSVILGVALTALVTAAAGPISFVALAAPQIARRLVRGSGVMLVPSALVGSLVLLGSDVLAQRLGFPVGVVTVSLGGAYLVWLLAVEFRARR
ncbi:MULTISPECIES: FecCD family ABC transporter permease [Brachybacterium]|uniref:FecCD family ABC transporter permease n=1 Tax=Brachybacterium TaxID=43668 RepID=UPI000DF1AFE7|nr:MULTISPECIES: iron chelate uptake ABC transporter family permease subunit [Brachybacterium]RCS65503.1 iron-enterobactin ABC transporter permease [Brachybacterium sp. JB7]RCS69656.1 iron-enterobactin ABC transporter permease [Brachybacterium alimentarium]RCS77037.1 iron-enterobactin ABC transporter permease [Brachybacterium alimentarium]RCS78901.1 iron-enterobactin ABC transporter permease [Brachybacterium alimentarium]